MTDETTDDTSGDDTPTEAPPTEQTQSDGSADAGRENEDTAPLSDLAARVSARRSRSEPDSADREELFEEVSVSELADDDVWTALVETEGDGDEDVGVGTEAEPVDEAEGLSDYIVPKAEFCHRCEYFGAPPTLGCGHDGTAIVEVVDSDHFRVRNCPMVEDDD
ncbi:MULTISPECIES: hypothetical protein [Haloferax]|uniref:DUF8135 domain-containing protein n=1 Tax=Haloferax marinum TaxID=2666143 RepID=A0A6A8GA45_9EURY|nr:MULTISPECIES: hypothetical protein [Haloferax]KAB1198662.1 hypothetical protein Hfx1150_14510 [Haloferax sp. CBA1150]MRW97777.1 hypothetical protein [Haloferax marinum]